MMHYKKGKNVEEELTKDSIPIDVLPKNFLWMHVKGGTKISNVIDFAKKALDNKEYRNVVWSGSEGGVVKTISCAEILKRNYPIHQVTRICYRQVDEFWEPQVAGLDKIVATRKIPCIHILQSLDSIDSKTLGYQAHNEQTKFWTDRTKKQPQTNRGGEGTSESSKSHSRKKQKVDQQNQQKPQKDKQKGRKKAQSSTDS